MKKIRPISHREVLKLAVTDIDPFTALRYVRYRENVPRLPELEDEGQKVIPGAEGALADLYHALWNPEPAVKEEGEIAPDRKYWRELLGQTMETSAYAELHAATELKELQSVLGTIGMGETIFAIVPEEDKEKLQELNEAARDADAADDLAREAEANAQSGQQLADAAAEAAGQAVKQAAQNPGDAQAQAQAAQVKTRVDQLAQEAGQAQSQAEAARMSFGQAKALAEELAKDLMGEPGSEKAQKRSEELRRMGLAAVKSAQARVKDVSDTLEAWGIEPGELTRESFAEVQAILERIKRNPALKKFQTLLGRLRQIAARKARPKDRGEGVRVTKMETGRDLKRAVPSELLALSHPALAAKAQMRWARGELRLREQKTRRKLGHGPVILAEDGSGSMAGEKQMWAKAMTLAMAHYAKLQRRGFAWIHFGAEYSPTTVRVYPRGMNPRQLLEVAETFLNAGGTSFERPLREAVKVIREQGLKKADILLVTDGMCAVSEKFLKELLAVKRALEVNIFTVLVNVGETADATVREFSDKIIPISALTADEAENKIIRHL